MFGLNENIGWFYEWGRGSANFSLIGAQLVAVLFIFGWTFTIMGTFFLILKFMGKLRISELEEQVGMDVSFHKGAAYDLGAPNAEHVAELNKSRSSRGFKGLEPADAVVDNVEKEEMAEEA